MFFNDLIFMSIFGFDSVVTEVIHFSIMFEVNWINQFKSARHCFRWRYELKTFCIPKSLKATFCGV